MDKTKAAEKKGEISQDDVKDWSDEIQKITDQYVNKIDEVFAEKERDIKQV